MLFIAHALDKADNHERRLAVLADHRAYLDQAPEEFAVRVLLSGPLTSDDGETMIGSFFLLEAEHRRSVEALFAGDPMTEANVWTSLSLHAVMLRQNAMHHTNM